MTHDHVTGEVVITATEFKAKCLELLDRVKSGAIKSVRITKRGEAVGVLTGPTPAADEAWSPDSMWGSMRGSLVISPEINLDKPIYEQVFGRTVQQDMGLED
ncbi:MAG: type II toxin-antitoxin system Phd/YefM family antitoxin [Brevundimonas sp.]|jgi:prevent-host-death family protein|uniref:type II toxin-antitoxin system Phd/YefM family antitoxin n=1 Tax=Brevundimonas sp. TaxID=1871086 RepID=UPI0022CD1148|nr:type II toxin-antitoxin system prevent-host-death family antitoxin [Brevundimonas sp.]MCZ8087829.1 type II toxin-antitoxin system prevent-host-death family antitoxin [Brevundimonas sp.]MCZ8193174.1 type II toxin-antitoxin system prevent-host-death family antitoxin [Brevundimonas sp.]